MHLSFLRLNTPITIGLATSLIFGTAVACADTSESIVAEIRKNFERAQVTKKVGTKIQREGYGPDGDGSVTAYRTSGKHPHVSIIEKSYAIGHHGGQDSYYYSPNAQLYFVFESASSFGAAADPISSLTELRLYFHNDKLIRCLERSISDNSQLQSKIEQVAQAKCTGDVNSIRVIEEAKALLDFIQMPERKQNR